MTVRTPTLTGCKAEDLTLFAWWTRVTLLFFAWWTLSDRCIYRLKTTIKQLGSSRKLHLVFEHQVLGFCLDPHDIHQPSVNTYRGQNCPQISSWLEFSSLQMETVSVTALNDKTGPQQIMLRSRKCLWSQVYNYSKCQCQQHVTKASKSKTKGIKDSWTDLW